MSRGARKGMSAADVVQSCDMTFCCVADSVALKEVFHRVDSTVKLSVLLFCDFVLLVTCRLIHCGGCWLLVALLTAGAAKR